MFLDLILYLVAGVVGFLVFVGLFVWFRRSRYWKKQIERSLKIVPLLITIPRDSGSKDFEAKSRDDRESMKEIISAAESFYSSVSSLYNKYKIVSNFFVGAPHITAEIVAKDKEIFFYLGVPYPYLDMIEKAISSQYPDCFIERAAEHNIFNKDWGIDKVYGGEIRATNSYLSLIHI